MAGGTLNRLSDKACKAFLARKAHGTKLSDGGGMYLFITPAGTASWRIKYRMEGKEKTYSVGNYPEISLAAARAELTAVKALLRENKDPVTHRRITRAETSAAIDNTFQSVAALWLEKQKKEWLDVHYKKSERALERDIYPSLGKLPITSISPAIVANVIEGIRSRGVDETARRILHHVNCIFRYAQAKGLCRDNPAAPVSEILPRKNDKVPMPALVKFIELGDVLRRGEMAQISPMVRLAHRLCAYTAMRISNVVSAEWKEFDLNNDLPLWVIPRRKMKVKKLPIDHRIPLPAEIAAELRQWKTIIGSNGYVFPSLKDPKKHITRESLEKVYRVTLGLKGLHSPHSWRSSFSSLSKDHKFPDDVVEISMDHAYGSESARDYDRGERFDQRIELFRWWGKNLSTAQQGATVIPLKSEIA